MCEQDLPSYHTTNHFDNRDILLYANSFSFDFHKAFHAAFSKVFNGSPESKKTIPRLKDSKPICIYNAYAFPYLLSAFLDFCGYGAGSGSAMCGHVKGLLEAPSLTDAIGDDPFSCRGIAQAIRILRQEQQAIHVQWELRPGM